jgi:hemoglobin-like flavoprotein
VSLDAALLRSSLELVSGREALITLRFYEILFARYPEVEPLFSRNREEQAKMLQESIVAVLDHLEQPDWLQTELHTLGKRHVGYGVTAEMYPKVAESLIATLAEIAGDDWTPEMGVAWTDALNAVAGLMLEGHALAEGTSD